MKFLAFILSFQLCFMVAEPVLAQLSAKHKTHSCCEKNKHSDKKDCCDDSTACAYFNCACCVVAVKEEARKTELFCRFSATPKIPLHNENFLADFHSANFRPPQIV